MERLDLEAIQTSFIIDGDGQIDARVKALIAENRALRAALPVEEQGPRPVDPRETEWAFRDGFYAGAGYMGWSDADAAGCDAQIGRAQEEAWEKRAASRPLEEGKAVDREG